MIDIFDILYKDSLIDRKFNNLMDLITCDDNILLAYRNIKKNTSSNTSGTDNRTIKDIENYHKINIFIMLRKNFKIIYQKQ